MVIEPFTIATVPDCSLIFAFLLSFFCCTEKPLVPTLQCILRKDKDIMFTDGQERAHVSQMRIVESFFSRQVVPRTILQAPWAVPGWSGPAQWIDVADWLTFSSQLHQAYDATVKICVLLRQSGFAMSISSAKNATENYRVQVLKLAWLRWAQFSEWLFQQSDHSPDEYSVGRSV